MSIGKTLDLSIKKAERDEADTDKFYELGDRRYENYIDNESWKAFVDEMRVRYPSAYKEYGEGSGDELGIKKIGRFPPKMASYGSSSRMIYLLSRDIPGFCFEKKFPSTVGGIANMDGYLYSNGTHYYVEAKCREPYFPKSYVIDRKYEDLYRYLDQDSSIDFNCKITVLDEEKMDVLFIAGGVVLTRFDIKQMISHMLGIATDKLNHPTDEKTVFLYLLYNPKQIEIVNHNHQTQIMSIYETEVSECKRIPFEDLYRVITQYLFKQKEIGIASENEMKKISNNFAFTCCDQTSYIRLLK